MGGDLPFQLRGIDLHAYFRCPACYAIQYIDDTDPAFDPNDLWTCDRCDEQINLLADDFLYAELDVITTTVVHCEVCDAYIEFGSDDCPYCCTSFTPEFWDGWDDAHSPQDVLRIDLPSDERQELYSDVFMLCCDRPVNECRCSLPIDYREIDSLRINPYDQAAVDSCHACRAYLTSMCPSLRDWIKAYTHEDYSPPRIRRCGYFHVIDPQYLPDPKVVL